VGETAKSAAVTTNDPAMPNFTLILRARFKPASPPGSTAIIQPGSKRVGALLVEPTDRWTTSTLSGVPTATNFYLVNVQSNPIRIKQVVPGGSSFIAHLNPIQDGVRYELNISTSTTLKPGRYAETLRVITDAPQHPEVLLDLDVTVYSKVFATPTSIILPPLPAADPSSINLPLIYVRKVREGGLKITKYSSSLPFLKLDLLAEQTDQVYRIRLTIDQTKIKRGEFTGTITILTNDADQPVIEVPIKGFFS
jgi:hypothetical protein